jgi:predicted DNA binding CopG/RHH family protein
MSNKDLDQEERELLESYAKDEWQSAEDITAEATRFREYAKATVRKNAQVNIRLSSKDIEAIQKKALEEGIPYQTLIASVIHKYVTGRLVDRS